MTLAAANIRTYNHPGVLKIVQNAIKRTITDVLDPEIKAIDRLTRGFTIDITNPTIAQQCRQLAAILSSPCLDTSVRMGIKEIQAMWHGDLCIAENTQENTQKEIHLKEQLRNIPLSESELKAGLRSDLLSYWVTLAAMIEWLNLIASNPEYLEHIANKKPKKAVPHDIMRRVCIFFENSDESAITQFLEEVWGDISLDELKKIKEKYSRNCEKVDAIWENATEELKLFYKENNRTE